MTVTSQTIEAVADRLATEVTREAILFNTLKAFHLWETFLSLVVYFLLY